MKTNRQLANGFFIAVSLFLAACAGEYQPAREIDKDSDSILAVGDTTGRSADSIITRVAEIDSVTVQQSQAVPNQVRVLVTGNLPDACTKLDSSKVRKEGNTFMVMLETRRLKDEQCAQVVTPYETMVNLDVTGLRGTFEVNVNGTIRSFNLLTKEQLQKK
jgi:hypothetical protein